MGRRGPAPTPSRILELRGSWRAGKRGNEPRPPVEAPSCPTWLSREARAEWKRIVPALSGMGILAKADRACLTAHCVAWARLVMAARQIEAEGLTYKSDSGQIKKHPLAAIAHEAAAEVRAFAAEFGLSPAGRARIHVTAPEPEDALTRFLADDPKAKYARPGSKAPRRQRG